MFTYAPGTGGIKNYEEMATKLAPNWPRSVTPAVYQTLCFPSPGKREGWSRKASTRSGSEKVTKRWQRIAAGSWTFLRTLMGLKALLMGKQLAGMEDLSGDT